MNKLYTLNHTRKEKYLEKLKENKKAQKRRFILFSILVVCFIGFAIATTYSGNTFNFIANSSTYLGHTNVSSPVVQTYNETWLNFDGVNDKINIINSSSLYFNPMGNYTFITKINRSVASSHQSILIDGLYGYTGISFLIYSTGDVALLNSKDYSFVRYSSTPLNIPTIISCVYIGSTNSTNCFINGSIQSITGSTFNWSSLTNNFIKNISIGGGVGAYPLNSSLSYIQFLNYSTDEVDNANFNYMPSLKRFYLNTSNIGTNTSNILLINSTLAYKTNGLNLSKSTDGGFIWNDISQYGTYSIGVGRIYRTSLGSIFLSSGTKNLSVSIGNDNNFTQVPFFICDNSSGEGNAVLNWGFAEAKDGSLLAGEYFLGNSSIKNCSYIHKSTDGGFTWNLVYNGSSAFPEAQARHIHIIRTDPYSGYIYATQGDGAPNSRLLRSIDNGTTWESIFNKSTDAQFLSIVFTPTCRILGTDTGGLNKIYKTCNDIDFNVVYRTPSFSNGYIWDMQRDNLSGYIIAGTQTTLANANSLFIISPDDGNSWFSIKIRNETSSYQGISYITSFDEKGYALYYDNNLSVSKKFNILQDTDYSTILNLQFNENNGTTAYDSSGNNNHGTITGATWQNDGVLKTLVENVDYILVPATGVFSLLNMDYLYSWLMTSFDYSNDIIIESPLPQTYTNNLIDFNITLDEEGDTCYSSDNGGANQTMTKQGVVTQFKSQVSFADGSHSVRFSCNDTSGNWGTNSVSFTVGTSTKANLDSLTTNILSILIGFLAIALVLTVLGIFLFYVKNNFQDIQLNEFFKAVILFLIAEVLVIALMLYISSLI
jgi:hypothetical protein